MGAEGVCDIVVGDVEVDGDGVIKGLWIAFAWVDGGHGHNEVGG